MFVTAGGVSAILSGAAGGFAVFMFCGLVFSWFGDLFLHLNDKKSSFITGLLFFMTAHFMYLTAIFKAWNSISYSYFLLVEIIIIAALVAVCIVYAVKSGINLKTPLFVPVGIYGVVLSTMFVKAVSFGFSAIHDYYLYPTMYTSSIIVYRLSGPVLLMAGALFFFLSDATLGILKFNKKQKDNFPLKCFNMATYFGGQFLLASTIIFLCQVQGPFITQLSTINSCVAL